MCFTQKAILTSTHQFPKEIKWSYVEFEDGDIDKIFYLNWEYWNEISNYTSKNLNLNDSKSYRNFLYPIYAQDDETRQNLKLNYENTDEDQKDFKYHSGSHYSNAGFVCYYLIRIKPFSQLAAEVQGELAGQKIVFSTNNARTIGHPYANKKREREN